LDPSSVSFSLEENEGEIANIKIIIEITKDPDTFNDNNKNNKNLYRYLITTLLIN
jgi:hypothetical protein